MLSAPPVPRIPLAFHNGPRSIDWGIGMTVCVAAISAFSGTIVTASDRYVTWGAYSGNETALKAARIAERWIVMIAGDDITRGAEDVIRHTRATLKELGPHPSVQQVQGAVMGAWREVQITLATAAVLAPFGMTMPQFLRDGKHQLGVATFLEMFERIQTASRLKCQLLVAGFDENRMPALIVVDDDNPWSEFTRGDLVAIGSGDSSAIASLSFHGYNRNASLESAVYQVCAAKFMAERSIGVGKDTVVLCLNDKGQTAWIFKTHVEQIRALWEKDGRPRMPSDDHLQTVMGPIMKLRAWNDP